MPTLVRVEEEEATADVPAACGWCGRGTQDRTARREELDLCMLSMATTGPYPYYLVYNSATSQLNLTILSVKQHL